MTIFHLFNIIFLKLLNNRNTRNILIIKSIKHLILLSLISARFLNLSVKTLKKENYEKNWSITIRIDIIISSL